VNRRCRLVAAATATRRPRPSSRPGRGPRAVGLLLAAVLLAAGGCTSTTPAPSDAGGAVHSTDVEAPPPTWLVTLGDSYISGQGARWAGNTSGRPGPVDALGPDAYGAGEAGDPDTGCARARMSVAALGGGPLRGRNLACSGATLASRSSGRSFVPGLDWYDDGNGHRSQLIALRHFASSHHVSTVVVSIGGNDFGFGSLLGSCVATFIATVGAEPQYCKDDPAVTGHFSPARTAAVSRGIGLALTRVARAMRQAGRGPASYRIVVESYPSPLAPGGRNRYPQTFLHRLFVGGCPVFDADATWAADVVVPTIDAAVSHAVRASGLPNVFELDLSRAFTGHRLCETGASQLQDTRPRIRSWHASGAMAQLEWVNEVYTKSWPWRVQESLHPNYFGALAERRCVLAAVRSRSDPSGSCVDGRFRRQ
jgi:hypothetical protein